MGSGVDRPTASSPVIKTRMERQRRRDTKPELELRRELWRRGLRYRVDRAPIKKLPRRRADIVFGRARVAVFVDGCFWHGCPDHGTLPKANAEWWRDKIEANRVRDADTDRVLAENGWRSLRVWEHEDLQRAASRVEHAVRRDEERAA